MKKLLLGLSLICTSFVSTAEANQSKDLFNLQCIKSSTKHLVPSEVDTNKRTFVHGNDSYNLIEQHVTGTIVSIEYQSQHTNNLFLFKIDTYSNKSQYSIVSNNRIVEEGICVLDNSVLI